MQKYGRKAFESMDIIDSCAYTKEQEEALKGVCESCDAPNCIRSKGFWLSKKFWEDYEQQKKLNDAMTKLKRPIKDPLDGRKGFRIL